MTKQKIALITGGSRGIGAEIVEKLAKHGFAVAINYASNSNAAEILEAKIKQAGGKAISIQCDISNASAVQSMFNKVEKELGPIDVLVNNAGIMKLAKLEETTDEMLNEQIAINLTGTFNMLRLSAKRIVNGGRIINLSTSVVGLKLETYGVYAATKSAIETMSAIFAKELRGKSITVNTVAPGPTATDLFLDGKSNELIDKLAKMSPMERLGTPEDIANVIAFLASPEGSWINGQVIRANGGMI